MSDPSLNPSSPPLRTSIGRRHFLRLGAAGAFASGLRPAFSLADPAEDDSAALYHRFVPKDKSLRPDWIASLVSRDSAMDAPIRCNDKSKLPHIGMTVGGIGCGTVYLSGDGRLYVWDIFNQHHEGVVENKAPVPPEFAKSAKAGARVPERDGANYILPPTADSHPGAFRQGFEIAIDGATRRLSAAAWKSVEFRGDWPLGRVRYADPGAAVEVLLEAWTPFIPLDVANSSWPVTVMEFEVHNTSHAEVEVSLRGLCENPVFCLLRRETPVPLSTRIVKTEEAICLVHEEDLAERSSQPGFGQEDIRFADFEGDDYAGWLADGTAFGDRPVKRGGIPSYQGDVGGEGGAVVNSHASAPGASIKDKDAATGTLTSPEFVISRRWIKLQLGGGKQPGETGVELLLDGEVVASRTGANDNRMEEVWIDVAAWQGRNARLRLIDRSSAPWGNTGADAVVFTDQTPLPPQGRGTLGDAGGMVFACMDPSATAEGRENQCDRIHSNFKLAPGEKRRVSYAFAWHFPNLYALPGIGKRKPAHAARFANAEAVMRGFLKQRADLRGHTFRWAETWYDSTLPRWLMDRAVLTTNTLQTANCFIFENGRFWAWEGVGACPGTCTHVWHYAQGVAALFPEIERNLREVTDFGVSLNPDGGVRMRAEAAGVIPIDGQAAIILRTLREHLNSKDAAFLRRVWPGAKAALGWLIRFDEKDKDGLDGLLDGAQHNTLDADWYGKVHCLCSLYIAALRAGEFLAGEVGDAAFANRCKEIAEHGARSIRKLFNGNYYIQIEDPAHAGSIGVGRGCYIDQVIGQWWAHLTGLGRIYDAKDIRAALHALWNHNFVPDIGRFREGFPAGRFYAMRDEAGLIMCSWPDGGLRPDFKRHWQFGYFNECMTGFEYQAASHMIQEGAPLDSRMTDLARAINDESDARSLTLRGLAVGRAVHDRYSPARRNPYNEIECSDHYGRSGSSYALFLAATGYRHHGPNGELGFAPKINADDFRSPFTASSGWGQYRQTISPSAFEAEVEVRYGTLRLSRLIVHPGREVTRIAALHKNQSVSASIETSGDETHLVFTPALEIGSEESLVIQLS